MRKIYKVGDKVISGKRTIKTILTIDESRGDYCYETERGSWCKYKHIQPATKKNVDEMCKRINKYKIKHREHYIDGRPCWCNPRIIKVKSVRTEELIGTIKGSWIRGFVWRIKYNYNNIFGKNKTEGDCVK